MTQINIKIMFNFFVCRLVDIYQSQKSVSAIIVQLKLKVNELNV